jgi:hypothetical protein
MTNKRIIICQPKPGSSMDFTDYSWMMKLLLWRKTFSVPCFHFRQNGYAGFYWLYSKNAGEKMYTFAKEQMDIVKTGAIFNNVVAEEILWKYRFNWRDWRNWTEEVTSFLKSSRFHRRVFIQSELFIENQETEKDNSLSELSQDALSKNYRIIRNCWTTFWFYRENMMCTKERFWVTCNGLKGEGQKKH